MGLIIDIAGVALCGWLLIKSIPLLFKVTWGITKFIATILIILALPLIVICLMFVGAFKLLIPLVVILIAFGLLKSAI